MKQSWLLYVTFNCPCFEQYSYGTIILMKPCNSSNPSLNISVQQYRSEEAMIAALDETYGFIKVHRFLGKTRTRAKTNCLILFWKKMKGKSVGSINKKLLQTWTS